MSLINTKDGRLVIKDASQILFLPYTISNGIYVIGADIYDISAIIGDSIVIELGEGDKSTKENEFKSEPLVENRTAGRYAFTAQCLDMQNKVLKSLFGAYTVTNVEGAVAMPNEPQTLYVAIMIKFVESDTPNILLPKVQMDNRMFLQQFKTRAGQGNLSGSALLCDVAIDDATDTKHLYQFTNIQGTSTYNPTTPMLFVPKGHMVIIRRSGKVCSIVDFDNGTIENNIQINTTNGTWSYILS